MDYINELAPWERKKEYYNNIQLGKDVKAQVESINKQTKVMLAANLASTNYIIASQERISEGIDEVAYGIERVEEGIYELKAAFEWGISEVIWQVEQNRKVLKTILEVLMAPLDTQAKELRRRAEEAYANGWHEDALCDFLESEKKNRYDFTVHISIGMIYFFHLKDKNKSLEYFNKAIRYATPKSAYHTSYALLYKALIKRDMGDIKDADESTSKAAELSPDFSEVIYQNAIYNALLNKTDIAMFMLKKAILLDKNYCLKDEKEEAFKSMEKELNRLLLDIKNEEKNKAKKNISTIKNELNVINTTVENENINEDIKNKINKGINRADMLINRDSYFDSLEVNNILFNEIKKDKNSYISFVISHFEKIIKTISHDKQSIIDDARIKKTRIIKRFADLGTTLGWILGFSGCLVTSFFSNGYLDTTPQDNVLMNLFFSIIFPIAAWVIIFYVIGGIFNSFARETSDNPPKEIYNLSQKEKYYLKILEALKSIKVIS